MRIVKWKRMKSLLLAVVMAAGMLGIYTPTVVEAAQPNVTIKMDTGGVSMLKRGDTVTVTVSLDGNGSGDADNPERLEQVWGLQLSLVYDVDIFTNVGDPVAGEVIEAANSTDFGFNMGVITPDSDNGKVTTVIMMVDSFGGKYYPSIANGVLFSLALQVKENAAIGETELGLSNIALSDATSAEIPYTVAGNTPLNIILPATGVSLNTDSLQMKKGETETLVATVQPEGSSDTVSWSSDDSSVAAVENGKVTAVGPGTTTLRATAGEHSAECEVTVTSPLNAITISAPDSKQNIVKGETLQLSVSYDPEDTTDSKAVTWKSSEPSVATVDENGLVTALADGVTTITAETENGVSGTYEIIVQEIPLQSISITEATVEINKGSSRNLTVTYNPENTTDDRTVTWESENPDIATVAEDGTVTAVAPGTTTITARVGDKEATCSVSVLSPMTGIASDQSSLELVKNQSTTIGYTRLPADTTDMISSVEFESSDSSVATVDDAGNVTAKKAGTAVITIRATSNANEKFSTTVDVTVTEIPIHQIILDKLKVTLEKGSSEELNATIEPHDNTDDDRSIRWESSDESIVTVKADAADSTKATITASTTKGGTVTITATAANGTKATCEVFVPIHITSISLPDSMAMNRGETQPLSLTILPEDTTDDKTAEWDSSNSDVVQVDGQGNVTAAAIGEATITAKVGDKQATTTITVVAPLKNIIVTSGTTVSLYKNETAQISYTLDPEDTTDSKKVEFESSNPEVASVSASGEITAKSEGTATITLKGANDVTASVTVNVTEIPISQVTLDKTEATIEKGEELTLTAEVGPSNNTDDVQTVTWSSSDESIVTVDQNGVVTATQKGGRAVIMAASDARPDVKATCAILVPIHLESIWLPETAELARREETILELQYEPSDTTDDTTVSWESSDESIASVDAVSGRITAWKAGTVSITARTTGTATEFSDTTVLTVTETHLTEAMAEEVKLTGGEDPLLAGTTTQILPGLDEVVKKYGVTDDVEVSFSTDSDTIRVDQYGIVTGVKEGDAVVTIHVRALGGDGAEVLSHDYQVDMKVTENHLTEALMQGVYIARPSDMPLKGQKLDLNDLINLDKVIAENHITDRVNVKWSGSDEEVALVDEQGTLTGRSAGETTVTATITVTDVSGKETVYTKEVILTIVEVRLESIAFDKTVSEMNIGETTSLTIKYHPADTTDDLGEVVWSSSNENIVSVKDGVLTAKAAGKAVITATANGKTVSQEITVKAADAGDTAPDTSSPSAESDKGSSSGSGTSSGGSSSSSSSSDGSVTNKVDSAHTADTSNTELYIVLALAMTVAIGYLVRRLKKIK